MEQGSMEASSSQEPPAPPALPWTVRLQIFFLVAFADFVQRRDGTVNRFFFSLVDRQARASARPDRLGVRSADVVVPSSDVVVKKSERLWARVFSPAANQTAEPPPMLPLPVVVYFHGGGFTLLSAGSVPYDTMCRRLCRELSAVVVSVNYRLAPENRCPAAYEDGMDVLQYLENTGLPADLGVPVDLSRCFLAGDSAGGNIVHHVAQRWTATPSPQASNPIRIAGTILVQPYFGGEDQMASETTLEGVAPIVNRRRTEWTWKAFLPEGKNRNHPAAHVTGETAPELAEGFPPAMVVIGGLDPLKDWQQVYCDMLQQRGKAVRLVEFPEAIHGFFLFPVLADAKNLVVQMKAFMDEK